MFSRRVHWDLRPNRLSEALRKRRESGARVLDLTESNPTHAGLKYPDEILSPLCDFRSLLYEPAPAGLMEARAAVAAHEGVPAERVLLTASTSESYAWLFKLLADPGDEILAPRPSYPLFEFLAALESVRVNQYPLVYHNGWPVDTEALAAAITERTRAVIVVNPNNPTGSFLKRAELERLVAICVRHELAIISDEVFAHYAFAPDDRRVASLSGVEDVLTFCLSGLSKVAGLPQMKLGWMVVGGPAARRAQALERLEVIADTYLSVSTPIQHAAAGFLATGENVRAQIAERTRGNLDYLRGALKSGSACSLLDVEGGWYTVLRVPRVRSEEEWCLELLDREGVLVQPGFFYDFESEAFLVISLLTPAEIFREGVEKILSHG